MVISCEILLYHDISFVKQMLVGAIKITTYKTVRITHALIEIFGISKCSWKLKKFLVKFPRFYKPGTTMSGQDTFYFYRHTLVGWEGPRDHIGTQKYPFICSLPATVPSTWKGKHGSIKYIGRIVIQFEDQTTHIHLQEIILLPRRDLMLEENLGFEARKDIKRKFTYGILNLGEVEVSVWIPICGLAAGQSLPLLCTISNNSKIQFGGIIFVLTKKEIYRSSKPIKTARVVRKDICRVARMTDILQGKYLYYCVLETEPDTPPTNQFWHCQCCHLTYEVWVSIQGAIPRYSAYGYPNIDTPGIPITIGTESLHEWNSKKISSEIMNFLFHSTSSTILMERPPPDKEVEDILQTIDEELDEETIRNLSRQIHFEESKTLEMLLKQS